VSPTVSTIADAIAPNESNPTDELVIAPSKKASPIYGKWALSSEARQSSRCID